LLILLKSIRIFIIFIILLLTIRKDKYDLLSLLHLKVTNIHTYNFNLYQKNYKKILFVIYTQILTKYH